MKAKRHTLGFLTVALFAIQIAQAQNVKITPLGGKTGEFCQLDRALLFEDPTGIRILYDPGNTIAGGTDSRLGDVHVILISHAHGDHMGNGKLNQDPNSTTAVCTAPPTTPAPNTNVAEIAVAKNSAVVAGPPLASFLGTKIQAVSSSSSATAGCPALGLINETTFPRTSPCTAGTGLGSKRTFRLLPATRGAQVSSVTAEHPNELAPVFLADPSVFTSNGLPGAYVGVANGFVVTFTNGLKVYLSGDTGLTADMRDIVNTYYSPQLSVINISDSFVTGPEEAAFAITNFLRTRAVIPSHANEVATSSGIVATGTRTERFTQLASQGLSVESIRDVFSGRQSVTVYPPLSGVTMEFDGNGRCLTGCQGR